MKYSKNALDINSNDRRVQTTTQKDIHSTKTVSESEPFEYGQHVSSKGKKKRQSNDMIKLFFRGMRSSTTKKDIESALSQYGTLDWLKVPFSHTSNKNMGYGYVLYQSKRSALFVLNELRKIVIQGKEVQFIKYDPKVTNQFRKNHPQGCYQTRKITKESSIGGKATTKEGPKKHVNQLCNYTGSSLNEISSLGEKDFEPLTVQGVEYVYGYPVYLNDFSQTKPNKGTHYLCKPTSIKYRLGSSGCLHPHSNIRLNQPRPTMVPLLNPDISQNDAIQNSVKQIVHLQPDAYC